MSASQVILNQRSRIAYWSPLICAIILAGLFFAPFAKISETTTGFPEEVDNSEIKGKFYYEHLEYSATSEDMLGNDSKDLFSGDAGFKLEYDSPLWDDQFDEMGDLGEKLSSKTSLISYLVFFLIVLQLARIQTEWDDRQKVNPKTVNGLVLGVIGLIAISGFFAIFSDLEGSMEENLEEGDYDDYDWGLFGSATTELEFDDNKIVEQVKWGPSYVFWLFLIMALVAIIGSAANFSFLKEDLEIEDLPKWGKSEEPPNFFSKHSPIFGSLLLTLATLLVLTAIFTPWYNVEQTWEVQGMEYDPVVDDWNYTNTTHDISWQMNPFMLIYGNDTGLEMGDDGEETTSLDSFSEHNELANISPVILQLRWPLICAGLLAAFFLSWNYIRRVSDIMEGTKVGWSLLMMVGIFAIMAFGTNSFHSDMEKYAEDDLMPLTPNRNFSVFNGFAMDSFSGKSITSDSSGWFSPTTYHVQHEWGGGIGYYAAGLAQWLIVAGLMVNSGPYLIRNINEKTSPFIVDFNHEEWSSRPAIAALISVLLLTTLGSGMGELVVDSENAAPPGEHLWFVDWNSDWEGDQHDKTMSPNEEWVTKAEFGNSSAHVTSFQFFVTCDEGSQGLASDTQDSVDWSITPPEGVDVGGMVLSGSVICDGNTWAETEFDADYFIPTSGVYAETKDDVEGMIRWTNTGEGIWTMTVNANVNDGSLPLSEDSDLDVFIDYQAIILDEEKISIEKYED